jgi:histidine triad (HIT) family protein
MDIRPIREGHVLVIPKQEIDYFFDLDDDLLGGIMQFARPIAKAIEKIVPCEKVGVMVAGLEVPHAHVHLVPITDVGHLNFANARPADPEALAALAEKIRQALA